MSMQIKSATVQELDEFGAYFVHVTQAVQRAGIRDYGHAARITVHLAKRILVGFMTREDAATLGRDIGKRELATKAAIDAANPSGRFAIKEDRTDSFA